MAGALLLATAAAAGAAEPLGFELPTLDGGQFYRLVPGRVTVVNFWDVDCPPCRREMPALEAFAAAHGEALLARVTLSQRRRALDFLEGRPLGYPQLLAPAAPAALLRRFGDAAGVLPHTAVLREDLTLCATKTGEVDRQWLETAWRRCRAGRGG